MYKKNRPTGFSLVPNKFIEEAKLKLNEYREILNKYYDYTRDDNYISSGRIVKGSYKNFLVSVGNEYLFTDINSASCKDIITHLTLIKNYYETGGHETYDFNIPKIYFSEDKYVMEYVDFTSDQNIYGKAYKISQKYCKSQGQFLHFCIDICNLLPMDVESYYNADNILYFLDFGQFTSFISESQKNTFKQTLRDNLTKLCTEPIKNNLIEHRKYEDTYFNNCDEGISCVINWMDHV